MSSTFWQQSLRRRPCVLHIGRPLGFDVFRGRHSLRPPTPCGRGTGEAGPAGRPWGLAVPAPSAPGPASRSAPRPRRAGGRSHPDEPRACPTARGSREAPSGREAGVGSVRRSAARPRPRGNTLRPLRGLLVPHAPAATPSFPRPPSAPGSPGSVLRGALGPRGPPGTGGPPGGHWTQGGRAAPARARLSRDARLRRPGHLPRRRGGLPARAPAASGSRQALPGCAPRGGSGGGGSCKGSRAERAAVGWRIVTQAGHARAPPVSHASPEKGLPRPPPAHGRGCGRPGANAGLRALSGEGPCFRLSEMTEHSSPGPRGSGKQPSPRWGGQRGPPTPRAGHPAAVGPGRARGQTWEHVLLRSPRVRA